MYLPFRNDRVNEITINDEVLEERKKYIKDTD